MHSFDFDRIHVLYAGLVMLVPDSAIKKKNFKSDVCGRACACERGMSHDTTPKTGKDHSTPAIIEKTQDKQHETHDTNYTRHTRYKTQWLEKTQATRLIKHHIRNKT